MEPPESSNNDSFLGMKIWKNCSSILLSPVTTGLYQECGLLFFKVIAEIESGRWDYGKLKCHKTYRSYWDPTFYLQ